MNLLSLNFTDYLISYLSHLKNRKEFNKLRNQEGDYSLAGFDKLNCIYVHIPKSAGISINMSLFGNKGGGHKTASQYRKIFGPTTFRKYFKFTFVRNPYSRLLSAYLFLKEGGMNDKNRRWAEENLHPFSTFQDFVSKWVTPENIYSYYHFLPQHHFLCDKNMNLLVDFIGRIENIEDDFATICNRLDVKTDLQTLNQKSESRDWKSYYNPSMIEVVHDVYQKDFELLGYPKEIK